MKENTTFGYFLPTKLIFGSGKLEVLTSTV